MKKGQKMSDSGKEKLRLANLGKKLSVETRLKISVGNKGKKRNQENPAWKGDKVGIDALHEWIRRNKAKPQFCEKCQINSPKDLANISGEYKRDLNDFKWICRSCHMKEDGRIFQLKQYQEVIA
jgi:hypothetical protein